MPLVSKGYILDSGLGENDSSISLIFDKELPFMCTLTHVDMSKNINKFHIMHAIHSSKGFQLYTRSGRTGNKGRITLKDFVSSGPCLVAFKNLFKELTANIWEFRDRFEHRMGYYAVYSYGEKTPDLKLLDNPDCLVTVPKSRLHEKVDYLVTLLCGANTTKAAIDLTDIDYEMTSTGICNDDTDYSKMPVGMITQRNLQMAKLILLEIRDNISSMTPDKITRYSERYYSYVPLKASRGHPPKLDNVKLIEDNLDHIDDLSNITRTLELIEKAKSNNTGKVVETINEQLYESMNHNIVPLNDDHVMYNKIIKFIHNSHGNTHHFNLKPFMIFEILNSEQKKRYDSKFKDSTRKEFLVHGSRLCNWRSILEKGLLLDPTKVGAVITGKMFGNGIYWANSFSKSAQYCNSAGYQKGNTDKILCLAIAEVAVGKQLECLSSVHHNLDTIKGYDSVWGVGKYTPSSYYDHDNVYLPEGQLLNNPKGALYYDEKIIYDQDQYYFRYLVLVERN